MGLLSGSPVGTLDECGLVQGISLPLLSAAAPQPTLNMATKDRLHRSDRGHLARIGLVLRYATWTMYHVSAPRKVVDNASEGI